MLGGAPNDGTWVAMSAVEAAGPFIYGSPGLLSGSNSTDGVATPAAIGQLTASGAAWLRKNGGAAGLLVGTGILILIRHGASLGGVTIMAVYLQKTRGWRAGHVQMAIDACILMTAFALTDAHKALLSLLGAFALNLVIAVNHRADRYYGA
jgi:hypothetical protein